MAYFVGHVPAIKMRGVAPNVSHVPAVKMPINGQYIHQYVAAHAGSVLRSPTGSISRGRHFRPYPIHSGRALHTARGPSTQQVAHMRPRRGSPPLSI